MTPDENIPKLTDCGADSERSETLNFSDLVQAFESGKLCQAITSLSMLTDCFSDTCEAALLTTNIPYAVSTLRKLFLKIKEENFPLSSEMNAKYNFAVNRLDKLEVGGWVKPDGSSSDKTLKWTECPFPEKCFTPEIDSFLNSVASNLQVSRGMVFPTALASFALSVMGKYVVEYPDATKHREHLCLYLGIVAEPSERKTDTFKYVLKNPFNEWLQGREDSSDEKADFIADNCTPEFLKEFISDTGGRAAICTDEPDFLNIFLGLYNKGKSDISVFLKGYDGGELKNGRISTGENNIKRVLITLCAFIQPALYEEFVNNPDAKGRGAVARCLFCRPQRMTGKRKAINNDAAEIVNYAEYANMIKHYLNINPAPAGEEKVIKFDSSLCNAESELGKYLQSIEDSMNDTGFMSDESAFAGKQGGILTRIAAILHLASGLNETTPISPETAHRAIEVHKYFWDEKRRDMRSVEQRNIELKDKVFEWILRETIFKHKAHTSVRDIFNHVRNCKGLKSVKNDLHPILETLESEHLIELEEVKRSREIIYLSPYCCTSKIYLNIENGGTIK